MIHISVGVLLKNSKKYFNVVVGWGGANLIWFICLVVKSITALYFKDDHMICVENIDPQSNRYNSRQINVEELKYAALNCSEEK